MLARKTPSCPAAAGVCWACCDRRCRMVWRQAWVWHLAALAELPPSFCAALGISMLSRPLAEVSLVLICY